MDLNYLRILYLGARVILACRSTETAKEAIRA